MLLAGSVGVNAEVVPGIVVSYVDAGTSDYEKSINSIGRITFADDNAIIKFKDSEAGEYNLGKLSGIKRISFDGIDMASVASTKSNVSVEVYPNPTSDRILVSGVEEGETIRMFSSEGKLVYAGTSAEISLANLKTDVYLLQVGKEIVKIIKK